jgi:mono/diheme cytochrome c family protein
MACSRLLLSVMILASGVAAFSQAPTYHLGRTPSEEEIRAWDIVIGPEGKELPAGSGTAKEGAKVYAQRCARCHGPTAAEGGSTIGIRPPPPLVGGQGTLKTLHPVRTVGSWWPFATTVWDYINRAMPLFEEGSLSPNEVYSLTAFLLYRNGILKENDVVDAKGLPQIQMPNRNGFVPPRPMWTHSPSNRGRTP